MNYEIIFSTYNNKTKQQRKRKELEQDLVTLAKQYNIEGFSLQHQTGYWAGELEQSHVLTLLDASKEQAKELAGALKAQYSQDAVILKPVKQVTYFI